MGDMMDTSSLIDYAAAAYYSPDRIIPSPDGALFNAALARAEGAMPSSPPPANPPLSVNDVHYTGGVSDIRAGVIGWGLGKALDALVGLVGWGTPAEPPSPFDGPGQENGDVDAPGAFGSDPSPFGGPGQENGDAGAPGAFGSGGLY